MLFNSYIFIFCFLPLAFVGFYFIGQYSREIGLLWLAFVSLFFYAWWDPSYLGLLMASIIYNYSFGYLMDRSLAKSNNKQAKRILVISIVINLLVLSYYKYANFFLENVRGTFLGGLDLGQIILPLGISFFTFTQIAFLVDTYQGKVKERNFTHYLLFVTYFPHLLAGPLLHHKDMMPQFAHVTTFKINWKNIAGGLAIFTLGLFKKVGIADALAESASPLFDSSDYGDGVMFFDAWVGVLAYSFQLYFDFSGYSDMAIGLSLMFNIRLPANFDSPYKAASIIDFWRRWHMTLSKFLKDYLYIPLGGNKDGGIQRFKNLFITMLLGGLWHGAGWTFVFWGGLHGIYLIINHGWRAIKWRLELRDEILPVKIIYHVITILSVIVGWVFFRSHDFQSAIEILKGMLAWYGVSVNAVSYNYFSEIGNALGINVIQNGFTILSPVDIKIAASRLILAAFIVFMCPNTIEIMQRCKPCLKEKVASIELSARQLNSFESSRIYRKLLWVPNSFSATLYGIIFFLALSCIASEFKSEFLYFQF